MGGAGLAGGGCFHLRTGVRKGPSLWLSPFGQSRYMWVDASEQPKFIDNQLFTGFKRLRSRFLGGGKLFPALNGCRWALFRFAGRSTAPVGCFSGLPGTQRLPLGGFQIFRTLNGSRWVVFRFSGRSTAGVGWFSNSPGTGWLPLNGWFSGFGRARCRAKD